MSLVLKIIFLGFFFILSILGFLGYRSFFSILLLISLLSYNIMKCLIKFLINLKKKKFKISFKTNPFFKSYIF